MKSRPLMLIALCVLTACSQGASPPPQGAAPAVAAPAPAQAASNPATSTALANPCDHAITAADTNGILIGAVARVPTSEPDTCRLETPTHGVVIVSVAKGNGAQGLWKVYTTYSAVTTPLTGVGDQAQYRSDGSMVIVRKGAMACGGSVLGFDNSDAMDSITKDRGVALALKLGALCSKALASP